MDGGLSFYNYVPACTINNLAVSAGATVSVVAGSLDSLKTRQLSDVARFSVNATTTGNKDITFNVIMPTAVPNPFNRTFAGAMWGVGMFGLLGVRPVSVPASQGGAVYPSVLTSGRLQAYTDTYATTGTVVFDTGVSRYMGNFGDQDTTSPGRELGMTNPWSEWSQGSQGLIMPLSEQADRVSGSALQKYNNQPWGASSFMPAAGVKAFKVTLTISVGAVGVYVIDVGGLWIGNRLSPLNGVNGVTHGFADQSQVVVSRDFQAYPQYFNKARTLSVGFPALYEIEAIGVGQHYIDGGLQRDTLTANCVQWAMTYLGTSRPCILCLGSKPDSNDVISSSRTYRNSIYGRPTQWQNLQVLPARKNPKPITMLPGQKANLLYSSGVTVQEER